MSEISLILNQQAPVGKLVTLYNSVQAQKDLAITFKPLKDTLYGYPARWTEIASE